MVGSNEFKWVPTQGLQRAIVIKSFLPLKKHPELVTVSDHILNLYAGDELYVFETTKDGKWLRAYLCWVPLPESYISLMDGIPQVGSKLVVVPRRFVRFSTNLPIPPTPFLKLPQAKDFEADVDSDCSAPSLYESGSSKKYTDRDEPHDKPSRPPFPFFRHQESSLVDEFSAAQGLLSSHIYRMYSLGEFEVFRNMISLYHQLDSLTLRLRFSLLTQTERTKVIRSASALLTNISKLISSRGKSNQSNGGNDQNAFTFNPQKSDSAGYESVFGRDVDTGQLLSYDTSSVQELMVTTMLQGLCKNFPVASRDIYNLDVPPNPLFNSSQSHIMVDVNDVTSDASIGNPMFDNLTASMYLSTKKEVLTEPFTVNIDSEHILSLNNISAALFKNIPDSKIQRSNIYLVVVLTERIAINTLEPDSDAKVPQTPPFIPFSAQTSGASLGVVTRGVAAGAVDISRVFAKYNNSFTPTGNSYKFKVYLFGSYHKRPTDDEMQSSTSEGNNNSSNSETGWGVLIDKILSNSLEGVAVNRRATSLSVSVKEISGKNAAQRSIGTSNAAIKSEIGRAHV